MALIAFANVSELDTPDLDTNFNVVAALGGIRCTATGTDTIALTTVATGNQPAVAAYTDNWPVFSFIAAGTTTTTPVTININGIGAKTVYKSNGAAAIGASDFVTGSIYYVAYNSTLNSSAGGFMLLTPGATAATAGAVQGQFNNLVVTNTTAGTPNTQCIVTATALAVSDGSTNYTTLLNVNVTINSGTSGANGIDSGSVANNTFYGIYVIYNPTTLTVAGLMSTSYTSPTLPSGYTQYALVGAMHTDGSAHFYYILQNGNEASYVVGTNPVTTEFVSGTAGTYSDTSPVLAGQSLASFIPSIAKSVNIVATGTYKGGAAANVLVAPNTAYGGTNRGPKGSVGVLYPIFISSALSISVAAWIPLESTSIAWASDAAGGALSTCGWRYRL